MSRHREFIYVVFDYETDKEIGSFASFTMDTAAKMRDYLVKHGDIPYAAYVRSREEIAELNKSKRG